MTDEQRADDAPPPPSTEEDRRRWWEKQRWLVPIAVVILGLAVFAVTAFVRSDRVRLGAAGGSEVPAAPSEDAAREGGPSDPAAAAPDDGGADDQGTAGGEDQGADGAGAEEQDGERPDEETAQVCQRIVALGELMESRGIDPLADYAELTEIEREARGTQLASQVNDVMRTAQRFATGDADADAVVAAGTELASAC